MKYRKYYVENDIEVPESYGEKVELLKVRENLEKWHTRALKMKEDLTDKQRKTLDLLMAGRIRLCIKTHVGTAESMKMRLH